MTLLSPLNQAKDYSLAFQNERETMKYSNTKQTISSICWLIAAINFIGVFIIGFGAETFIPSDYLWLLPAMFGCIFLFGGLGAALSGKTLYPLLAAGLGAIITIIAMTYGMGNEIVREILLTRIVPIALLTLFPIVGFGICIIPKSIAKKEAKQHPIEIQATVCKKIKHIWTDHDRHRHRGWKLAWKYCIDGKDRIYTSNITRNPEPRDIGDTGVLYLSETDPTDVWEKPTKADTIALFLIGMIFIIIGSIALIMFIIMWPELVIN